MDSPALGGVENIAGRALGTIGVLGALRGGGLMNYMNARARALSDPATRATLEGSPFTSGLYWVGGGYGGDGGSVAPPGQPMPQAGGVAKPEEVQPGPYASGYVFPSDGGVAPPVAPPAAQQVAAPSANAFAMPGYEPGTARTWHPYLTPYAPEQQLEEQARVTTLQGLQSPDPGIRAQARLAAKMPILDPGEMGALTTQASHMQQAAGPGSTVRVAMPGLDMTFGSPYNLAPVAVDEFPTYGQAAAAAGSRGPGWNVEQTNRGTFKPVPPPTREQILPVAPPSPVMRGGQQGAPPSVPPAPVTRGPVTVPTLPGGRGSIQPNAFVQGMVNRGWTPEESAAAAGNVHIESAFLPGNVNKTGGDSGLVQWTGPRLAGLQKYAAATGRSWQDPEAQMDWLNMERSGESTKYGGSDERGAFNKAFGAGGTPGEMAGRFGQFVERPADIGATVNQRMAAADMYAPTKVAATQPPPAGMELPKPSSRFSLAPSSAYAAEIPPGAQVERPPPPKVGAPAFDPNAVVPHVVVPAPAGATVGYPSAAPEPGPGTIVPAPIPQLRTPGAPAGIPGAPPAAAELPGVPVDPTTGLPLQSRTYESQTGSETYTAPPRGDIATQLKLRYTGISDPAIASPAQVVNYFATEQALKNNESMDKATIERMQRGMTEGESKEFTRLTEMKAGINDFLKAYPDPADRAKFLGLITAPLQTIRERIGWQDAGAIRDFRNAFSPFSLESLTDEKGKPVPGMEGIAQMAPSVQDSAGAFESNLQHFKDALDRRITIVSNLRAMPVGEATPALVNSWVDQLQHDSLAQRLSVFPQTTAPPAAPPPAVAAPPPPSAPPPPTATAPPWQPNWVQ